MKKKAVSLILSLCMTFSLFVQFVPLVKAEEISDIPDPWVNPQDYVDGTATFNLDWLVSFVCAKNPQDVTFDDIEDYRDLESINAYHEMTEKCNVPKEEMMGYLKRASRDNARTPMQGNSEENAVKKLQKLN